MERNGRLVLKTIQASSRTFVGFVNSLGRAFKNASSNVDTIVPMLIFVSYNSSFSVSVTNNRVHSNTTGKTNEVCTYRNPAEETQWCPLELVMVNENISKE